MRNAKSAGIAVGVLLLASVAQAATLHLVRAPVEATFTAIAARLLPRLSPAARTFIAREAAREVASRQISSARAHEMVVASRLAASPEDIDAMVQAIMMQCAADADADLRDALADMQNARNQKAALRGDIANMRAAKQSADNSARNTYAHAMQDGMISPRFTLDAYAASRPVSYPQVIDQMQNDIDSIGDLSDVEQLKLQELSDQRSKALEMLSNVMKSTSDTRRAIIDNMK